MPTTAKTKKVLLVEDDPFLSGMYQTKLKLEGFDVVSALDGEAALVKLQKDHFDIILLDIMMPKLNGFDVLKEIRKDKSVSKDRLAAIKNKLESYKETLENL